MTYAALTHIAGPAILTFDSGIWYTEGDIDVSIPQELWDVVSSRFGLIGRRIKSLPVATISFKPDGQITSGRMTKGFPYTAADVGKSIFGAADKSLVINTLAGQKYTFKRAGVSGCPGFNLSAVSTAFDGTMQFMAVHSHAGEVTVAGNFLAIAAEAFADVTFDQSKLLSPGYTAAWGTAFTAAESLNGFKVACPIAVSPISVDRFGVVDVILTSVGPASCRFAPAGMAEADWLAAAALDGASVRMPGTAGSVSLVITGTGLVVTLPNATLSQAALGFGTTKERLGEFVFSNHTVFTLGVPALPLTIAVS
jgi:hypothetical protein